MFVTSTLIDVTVMRVTPTVRSSLTVISSNFKRGVHICVCMYVYICIRKASKGSSQPYLTVSSLELKPCGLLFFFKPPHSQRLVETLTQFFFSFAPNQMLAFAKSALSACRRRLGGASEAVVAAHVLNRGPCESFAHQNRCVFFPFSLANHYAPKGRQNWDEICANIRQQLSVRKRNRVWVGALHLYWMLRTSSPWAPTVVSNTSLWKLLTRLTSSKLCQWVKWTFTTS